MGVCMQTGSRRARTPSPGVRGYTYLGVLVLLVVLGGLLAAAGTVWRQAAQRSKEAELRFRGEQIRQAITAYRNASTPAMWPPDLQALLQDRRSNPPRHHLRRLYTDPFTGQADWVLIPPPPPPVRRDGSVPTKQNAGTPLSRNAVTNQAVGAAATASTTVPTTAVAGVRSRATTTRLHIRGTPPADGTTHRVSDWLFTHSATAAPPPQADP
jgi:type II secretory pathway pseudopilin PulG